MSHQSYIQTLLHPQRALHYDLQRRKQYNEQPEQAGLRMGDAIELRRPDGSFVRTRVAGIERAIPYDPERTLALLLPSEIVKEDVPIGTEVWSHP